MNRLLIGGDWNAQPSNASIHRPQWIARGGGLAVETAGPGAFGDIDYVLTDANIGAMCRAGRNGSDHDLVIFEVFQLGHDGPRLLGGTWNVLAGRDPGSVARYAVSLMRRYNLDFLLLQEATGYHTALRQAGNSYRLGGFDLIGFTAVPGESQNPILVRRGLAHTSGHTVQLSRNGWPLAGGGFHAPIYATSVEVAGWLRLWSVHLPNFERGPAHSKAYRQAARRIKRASRRHRRRR